MELVTIISIDEHEVRGKNEFGTEFLISHAARIPDLKVGELIQGRLLHDVYDPKEFRLQFIQRVQKIRVGYTITGTVDVLVPVPDLEHVEKAIADDVTDAALLRGIDNDGAGIDGDQITVISIESIPDSVGNVKYFYLDRPESSRGELIV